MTKIHIERNRHGYVDRYRSYEVVVNGACQAELRRGESKTIEIDPGEVEIFVKIGWCRSRKLQLKVNLGSEARLVCRPRSVVTALYGLTFGRHDYVRLEPA